jgi:hypothetical protein
MNPPNAAQRVVLVIAAVAVLALAFYPPFFPRHISRGRFDIELAAVTLATIGFLLALRGLPKLSLQWRPPSISLASAGWKRLWIVFSFIYLVAVIGFSWHLYPTFSGEGEDTRPTLEEIFGPSRSTTGAHPTIDSALIASLREIHAREQRKFLIVAALWGILPIAGVYLFGMSLGWISQGFRSTHEKE